LLQEVVGENTKHAQKYPTWPLESQFEFLADTVWSHYSYGKNAVFSYRNHGNAILSHYPIVMNENLNISTNGREQRGLLHCVIEIPPLENKRVHVFNTHLNLLHVDRIKQFQKIRDRFNEAVPNHEPCILGGDFNDWSEALTPLFRQHLELEEGYKKIHGHHAKTFPAGFPLLKLDRIYSRGFQTLASQVLHKPPWNQLSDHLPLLNEFEIR
jgi:endonuclease/exonuclease/phosphatase family metal-dependent hydrolase